MEPEQRIIDGVGVVVCKDGDVLLGLRIARHGNGKWQLPGGHVEHDETIEQAAIRELREETGLTAGDPVVLTNQVDYFPEVDKTYRTHFVGVRTWSGAPETLEPAKCGGWRWMHLSHVPGELFAINDKTLALLQGFALASIERGIPR